MKRAQQNGEVLAHVAGPSGAGKTELMNRLAREIRNVELKDLDEYDDLAVERLGWTGRDKNDYTDADLDRLHAVRQALIDEDIRRIEKPIIFFGHHTEGGNVTRLPTRRKILLDVPPARSAVRVGRRPGKSLKDIAEAYRIAQEDREYLLAHGYNAEKPPEVFNHLMKLAREERANPGLLEALARIGGALGGANSAIDLHDKLTRKRVIRPLIGGRKQTMKGKRRKRNPVEHLDLPDDIVERLGRETVDAIFASEDPAGTVRALMTVAADEDDYWALQDYERVLAMMLAGGQIETEAREVSEANPRGGTYRKLLALATMTDGVPKYSYGSQQYVEIVRAGRALKKHPQVIIADMQRAGVPDSYIEHALQQARSLRDIYGKRNPSYTVHVSAPSVSESTEVKALTAGSAFRKGKRKLRSAAKVTPKWSVEKNPNLDAKDLDYLAQEAVEQAGIFQRARLKGNLVYLSQTDTMENGNPIAEFTSADGMRAGAIELASGNNLVIRDSNLTPAEDMDAIRLCAYLYPNKHGQLDVDYNAFSSEENPSRKRKRGATAILINPSEQVKKLSQLFTEADNRLEQARAEGTARQVQKLSRLRERLLTNLRYAEAKDRQKSQRNGGADIPPPIKSKLNKLSRIFHGDNNEHFGKAKNVEVSERVKARNFARAGHGVALKLLNDATGKHAAPNHWCEDCALLPNPETAFYGMTTGKKVQPLGKGFLSVGKKLKNTLDRMTDEELAEEGVARIGDEYDLGKADTSVYACVEKWSDIDDPDMINYFHEWAEETKRTEDKPDVRVDRNGMVYFKGGKHTVTKLGIEN